jgi:transcriptional regulator with XRE-family HTH domain
LKYNETVGQMIARLRNQKQWIQDELADYAGLSRNYVNRLENDKVLPDYRAILLLARVLEVLPSSFTDKIGDILDERYENCDFPEDADKLGL